ncbi:MAG: hypothetical protein U5K37_09730 [Natrialbaceae archaeon]|nr:hypothetical protein [Natrialbaceae archaeon]
MDRLLSLFRSNGIYAQWLEYPDRYDRAWFESRFGYDVRKILWSRESFYRTAVEPALRDIAVQVIVVPGLTDPHVEGLLYSPMSDATGQGRMVTSTASASATASW